MSDICKTVTIVGEDGSPLRINATDFNPEIHELVDVSSVVVSVPVINPDATIEQRLVAKDGKKFFIVNPTGVKIEGDGIDAEGYATEAAAWAAIMALATPAA